MPKFGRVEWKDEQIFEQAANGGSYRYSTIVSEEESPALAWDKLVSCCGASSV